jgi:tetratricopeptide (TPR) repeat protein
VSEDYDKALKDYIKSNSISKLNTAAYYNMIMCQGLKSLDKKEYENAISFFTKAGTRIPGNRDPYFLRAVTIVRYAMHKPLKPKTRNKMIRDAKRDLNRALKHSPKDY